MDGRKSQVMKARSSTLIWTLNFMEEKLLHDRRLSQTGVVIGVEIVSARVTAKITQFMEINSKTTVDFPETSRQQLTPTSSFFTLIPASCFRAIIPRHQACPDPV